MTLRRSVLYENLTIFIIDLAARGGGALFVQLSDALALRVYTADALFVAAYASGMV